MGPDLFHQMADVDAGVVLCAGMRAVHGQDLQRIEGNLPGNGIGQVGVGLFLPQSVDFLQHLLVVGLQNPGDSAANLDHVLRNGKVIGQRIACGIRKSVEDDRREQQNDKQRQAKRADEEGQNLLMILAHCLCGGTLNSCYAGGLQDFSRFGSIAGGADKLGKLIPILHGHLISSAVALSA